MNRFLKVNKNLLTALNRLRRKAKAYQLGIDQTQQNILREIIAQNITSSQIARVRFDEYLSTHADSQLPDGLVELEDALNRIEYEELELTTEVRSIDKNERRRVNLESAAEQIVFLINLSTEVLALLIRARKQKDNRNARHILERFYNGALPLQLGLLSIESQNDLIETIENVLNYDDELSDVSNLEIVVSEALETFTRTIKDFDHDIQSLIAEEKNAKQNLEAGDAQ